MTAVAILPVQRLRIELDRTLLARDFFARAVRGDLECAEYLDLLQQLGAFLGAASGDSPAALVALAARDASVVARACADCGTSAARYPVIRMFETALRCGSDRLDPATALDICVGTLGTSWASRASRHLSRRWPGAATFLGEVAARAPASIERVRADLDARVLDPHDVYAYAELARGAVLGLATHLDSTWPPPVVLLGAARR